MAARTPNSDRIDGMPLTRRDLLRLGAAAGASVAFGGLTGFRLQRMARFFAAP